MYLLQRARAPLVLLLRAWPAILIGRTRSARGEIEMAARGGSKRRVGCEINGWTKSAQGSAMEARVRARQRISSVGAKQQQLARLAGGSKGRAGQPSVVRRGRGWSGGSV
jgi:hypothetical protein